MAATGYSPIQIYYSTTTTAVPTAGNLASGELAINITDGILFYKDNAGAVQTLATKAGTSGTYTSITLSGGTANGVAYLNGSKVVTTGSAFTYNGSRLKVAGDVYVNSDTHYLLMLNAADSTWWGKISQSGSDIEFYNRQSGALKFGVADAEAMRLTTTGLGIGTSSPSSKLESYHTSTAPSLSSASGSGLSVRGSSTVRLNFGSDPASPYGAWIQSSDGAGTAYAINLNPLGGNVGIGTSSPALPLHVYNSGAALAYFESTNVNGPYVIWRSSGTSLGDVGSGKGISGTGNATDFMIASRSTYPLLFGTGSAERMRLDSSGNLGLGVTPSAWASSWKVLQFGHCSVSTGSATGVTGRFYANAYYDGTNDVYINSSSNYAAKYVLGASGQHQWFVAPVGTAGNTVSFTQAMTLDASGNLGIGTSSPGAKLDIGSGALRIKNASGDTSGLLIYQAASDTSTILNYYSGPLVFGTGNTERMRLDSSGNLGIAPQKVFGSGNGYAGNTSAASSATLQLWDSNGNTQLVNAWGSGNLIFGTANAERARIDSSGNLLVGKTSNAVASGAGLIAAPTGDIYATMASSTNSQATLNVFSTSASVYRFYVGMGGTVYATSTTITAISDQRLKENIRDLDDGLASVMALKPRKFDWKEGKGANIKDARGFIAQEFETVFPDMIEEWRDPAPEGEEPYKAINANLIPTLVKAIQEQQAQIESLRKRLADAGIA